MAHLPVTNKHLMLYVARVCACVAVASLDLIASYLVCLWRWHSQPVLLCDVCVSGAGRSWVRKADAAKQMRKELLQMEEEVRQGVRLWDNERWGVGCIVGLVLCGVVWWQAGGCLGC